MHKLSRRNLSASLRSAAASTRYRNSAAASHPSPLAQPGFENDNKIRWYSAVIAGRCNNARSAALLNLRGGGLSFGTRYESTSAASAEPPAEKFEYQAEIQQFVRGHSQIASVPMYNLQVEVDNDMAEAKRDNMSEVLSKVCPVGVAASAQISNRARFLPSVLGTGIFSWSTNMERPMMAQTVEDASSQQIKRAGMVFLIGPDNPIITNLNAALPVDKTALGLVDLQYEAASLGGGGVALDNLALMGGMIFLLRHVYTGINEIMLDYVHNKKSRTFIMILLQCYILISIKDVIMLLVSQNERVR